LSILLLNDINDEGVRFYFECLAKHLCVEDGLTLTANEKEG